MFFKLNVFIFLLLFLLNVSCAQKSSYDHDDRTWQEQADARIEKERKGKIKVVIEDSLDRFPTDLKVRVQQLSHSFSFGSAVSARWVTNPSDDGVKYREIIDTAFNEAVFESDMKWQNWKYNSGKAIDINQTLSACDSLKNHGKRIRGHNLVSGRIHWYKSFHNVITQDQFQEPLQYEEQLLKHMEQLIKVTEPYINEWDAINHIVTGGKIPYGSYPIAENDEARLDFYLGSNIYKKILEKAKTINPDLKLIINEGHLIPLGSDPEKIEEYFEISQQLYTQGLINGIGFMSHFRDSDLPSMNYIENMLTRFSSLGMSIKITEFDVRFGKKNAPYSFTQNELELQKQFTEDFLRLCFSLPQVNGIIIWGFWEGRHWYPSAALWDQNWNIKPNGEAWMNLIYNEWWTDETISLGENGMLELNGFLGDYVLSLYDNAGNVVEKEYFKLSNSGVTVFLN